jgi:hypothetical protein
MPPIKAVIIRPNGDVKKGLTRFTDKYILPTDPIFQDCLATQVSVLLDLPLLIQRLHPRDSVPENAYYQNLPATVLQMSLCGIAPMEWWRVGPVMVVRVDRKPLCCLHLEAIWKYHWNLFYENSSFDRDRQMKISKRDFEAFWEEFRRRQIEAGREDFRELVSPYDV